MQSLSSSGTILSNVFLNSASATSDSEKADLFNTSFHSVYKPSFSNPPLSPSSELTLTYNPNINNISSRERELFSALASLDPAKSVGVDCIGPKHLSNVP